MRKLMYLIVVIVALGLIIAGCIPTTPTVNQEPTITSTPGYTATVGMKYTYDVDATDLDGDALTYSLTTKPDGMVINSATGLIKWTPVTDHIGDNSVKVKVSDGFSSGTQSFTIAVTVREPMEITVDLPTFTVGKPYWFTVNMIANSDLDKLVVAHFGVPTSNGEEIAGTLEMGEGSDVIFALTTGGVFQTGAFTMKNVTAHFRGTFTSVGTYSTTIGVWTTSGIPLCSKDIEIKVIAERTIAIRWLEDAIRFNADGEVTNNWVNDPIPASKPGFPDGPAILILTDGEYHFKDVNDFYNTYLPDIDGSVDIDGTGQLTGHTTYTYPVGDGLSTINNFTGQVEIIIYGDGISGTMVGTYTQMKYVSGIFVGRTEYIVHGEETLTPSEPELVLVGIVVEPETMDLFVGEEETITSVTAHYNDSSTAPVAHSACNYTSDATVVATASNGVVTAGTAGVATITVEYGGKTDTIDVDVTVTVLSDDATLESLTVSSPPGIWDVPFDSDTYTYEVYIDIWISPPTVAAIPTNPNADVVITQPINQNKIATILVTAEDGITTETYTINFTTSFD